MNEAVVYSRELRRRGGRAGKPHSGVQLIRFRSAFSVRRLSVRRRGRDGESGRGAAGEAIGRPSRHALRSKGEIGFSALHQLLTDGRQP
jgi:hypothetical protein